MPEAEDFNINEAKVTYTTKELLIKIDQRFDKLESLAQAAPTRDDVLALTDRVQLLETGVQLLETDASAIKAVALALKNDKSSRFNKTDKVVIGVFVFISTLLNFLALGPDLIN